MKITVNDDPNMSVEFVIAHDLTCEEMVQYYAQALMAAGYQEGSITKAMGDYAAEMGYNEDEPITVTADQMDDVYSIF